jgi:hypothetical protein
LGVSERLELVEAEFMDAKLTGKFDACVALGYYDYQRDHPLPHLARMGRVGSHRAGKLSRALAHPLSAAMGALSSAAALLSALYSLGEAETSCRTGAPSGAGHLFAERDYLLHLHHPPDKSLQKGINSSIIGLQKGAKMAEKALGLIETKGLVAAIEAADAVVKAIM